MAKPKPGFKKVPKELDFEELDNFASGAEKLVSENTPSEKEHLSVNDETPKTKVTSHPWDNARADVKKSINLWLPEELMLKLRFISKHIPESQQEYLRNIITPVINKKINELIK